MEYSKLNSTEKFLASFNNEANGFAKVIRSKGKVILGFIGRFGYAVFEIGKDGYFNNVNEFGTIENSELFFEERTDQTGMLSLSEKIELIDDLDLKKWILEKVNLLKASLANLDKFSSIQASVKLGQLSKLSIIQLIKITQNEKAAI